MQSINGIVTNSFSEQPIQGVKITVLLNELEIDSTETNDNGVYHFDSINDIPVLLVLY